jgi:hypothetical protein
MRTKLWLAIAVAAAAAGTAQAHHSYAGYSTKAIEIEGVLEGLDWVNPHAFVKIRAANGFLYLGEWTAIRRLEQYGVHKDTLEVGDRLVITGLPRLDIDETGLITIRGLRRPADGWSWAPNSGVQRARDAAPQP